MATRLKDQMQEQGMTQAMLASATGLTKSAISQIVNGLVDPRPATLRRISECLHCTVENLTGAAPEPEIDRDVPVEIAAQLLGKSAQFVRNALIQGTAPFGFAVKGEGRYSFSISPHKLAEYVGQL